MCIKSKVIHFALIATQLAPLSQSHAALLTPDSEQDVASLSVTQSAIETGRMLQNGSASTQLRDKAVNSAGQEAGSWLNQFGTARVELRTDDNFNLKDSSLDFLLPMYQNADSLLFTQMGVREHEDRLTTNLGLGHRYLTGNWLLGYNAFYDATWRNSNKRWGVGLEAWRDYLRFSANGYKAISGWHSSRQHGDYDERPADGWDIRSEGWLPAFPQLGGRLMYEQYYGDEVALMGFSNRQKDPHAATVGVTLTPVPLVTTGVDYKSGKGGTNEARFNVGLTWHPGVEWHKQLDPDAVAPLRQLGNSRMALVDRNNTIVLNYRKQEMISLTFPARITGEAFTQHTFIPDINARHGVAFLELDDAQLRQAGGEVLSASRQAITLKLPASGQAVTLRGTAVDSRGNRSNIATTQIITTEGQHRLSLSADKTTLLADGSEAATFTLHVDNAQGEPLADESITFTADGGTLSATSGKTDEKGDVRVQIASSEAGVVHLTAIDGELRTTHAGITFVALAGDNVLTLTADTTTVKANGKDSAAITAHLTNDDGKPLAEAEVSLTTDGGTLSDSSGKTDAQGNFTSHLSSSVPGTFHVTARAGDREAVHEGVSFVADLRGTLTTDKPDLIASSDDRLEAALTLTDSAGGAIADEAVSWSTDNGTLNVASNATGANGEAKVSLSSSTPGKATITAQAAGQTWNTTVNVKANVPEYGLVVDKTTALGSNFDVVTYTLTARKTDGTPITGEEISWTTDLGLLSDTRSVTNDLGNASIMLSSYDPGVAHVQATVAGKTLPAPDVTFEEYLSLTLQYWGDTIPGLPLDLYLMASNSHREPLANEAVTWSVDKGTLSTVQSTTDADGTAYNTLITPDAGRVHVTATVRGTPTDATITFN